MQTQMPKTGKNVKALLRPILTIVLSALMFIMYSQLSPFWENEVTSTLFLLCALGTAVVGFYGLWKNRPPDKAPNMKTRATIILICGILILLFGIVLLPFSNGALAVLFLPACGIILIVFSVMQMRKKPVSTQTPDDGTSGETIPLISESIAEQAGPVSKKTSKISILWKSIPSTTRRIAAGVYVVLLLALISVPTFHYIQNAVTMAETMSTWNAIAKRWNQFAEQDPSGMTHGLKVSATELANTYSSIDFADGELRIDSDSTTSEFYGVTYSKDAMFLEHSDEIISQLSDIFLGPGHADDSISGFHTDFSTMEAEGYLVSAVDGVKFGTKSYQIEVSYSYSKFLKADDGTFGLRFDMTADEFVEKYNRIVADTMSESTGGDLSIQTESISLEGFQYAGDLWGYKVYVYEFPFGYVDNCGIALLMSGDYVAGARFLMDTNQAHTCSEQALAYTLARAARMFIVLEGASGQEFEMVFEEVTSILFKESGTVAESGVNYDYHRGFGYAAGSDGLSEIISFFAITEAPFEQMKNNTLDTYSRELETSVIQENFDQGQSTDILPETDKVVESATTQEGSDWSQNTTIQKHFPNTKLEYVSSDSYANQDGFSSLEAKYLYCDLPSGGYVRKYRGINFTAYLDVTAPSVQTLNDVEAKALFRSLVQVLAGDASLVDTDVESMAAEYAINCSSDQQHKLSLACEVWSDGTATISSDYNYVD